MISHAVAPNLKHGTTLVKYSYLIITVIEIYLRVLTKRNTINRVHVLSKYIIN